MAAPYTSNPPTWQPPGEMRSVTPATNNTRYTNHRYPSAPRVGAPAPVTTDPLAYRSMTPNRFPGHYGSSDRIADGTTMNPNELQGEQPRTPSSTGLIRLTLKKPMGIVFEPMYDPNQPSVQRGVRICDLPRTGAAALSRKLQVGDELLQINETTVSRLTFDEIMDFIIEADPENVNLLFRRPRKETLQQRQGIQQKINAANNKDAPSTVKWEDEEHTDKKKGKERRGGSKKKENRKLKRNKKDSVSEEEDETLQSSTIGEDSYNVKNKARKKGKSKRDPYEQESFLDMLIDTICSNPNNICRETFRRPEEDYSDEESFVSDQGDEETYATYDDSIDQRARKKTRKKQDYDDTETDEGEHRRNRALRKDKLDKNETSPEPKKYEDDGTLETIETNERPKENVVQPPPQAPLGLAAKPEPIMPVPVMQMPVHQPQPQVAIPTGQSDTEDDGNPAPIRELEYDDRIDHGADVSVMESLGGPSLLIEKQRAAAQVAMQQPTTPLVPPEIMDNFGLDYPPNFGFSREQTIEQDPLRFYTFVVKSLLQEHEPEKVRLLDKLLAKYKGREDHLVQKLSVRYDRPAEEEPVPPPPPEPDQHDEEVQYDDPEPPSNPNPVMVVSQAPERDHDEEEPPEEEHEEELQEDHDNPSTNEWQEKEAKEPDEGEEEEESESESEYSRDSVDGTSPAVIAQVSELLNYVYGKTSVPGQIDRVSTIMRAYEGREAVLLELLETKALIKANKEKENADNLPSFLRNSQIAQAQKNAEELEGSQRPRVTPIATHTPTGPAINDDISSMSGVSSPAVDRETTGAMPQSPRTEDDAAPVRVPPEEREDQAPGHEASMFRSSSSRLSSAGSKPPSIAPDRGDKKKKKGLFGGLFSKKKTKDSTPSRQRNGRKLKGTKSTEGSV